MKRIYSYLAVLLYLSVSITSCSNLDESAYAPVPNGKDSTLLSVTFETDLGGFTPKSVSGDQVWAFNASGYVLMSGYVSPTNYANEDWLISPEIDLTKVASAHLSFDHVARYFANLASEATVWISTDYKADSLPSTAKWTQLTTVPFSDPGSWTFVGSDDISLTAFVGQKVRIAFKYVSTASKAGTWEIKNFLVTTGEAVVVDYGKGTKDAPYTVTGATKNQSAANAWVKGCIVGYAWFANSQNNFYFSADTCTQATNVLIADSISNFYLSRCVAVQLPAGAVRNGLNLKDLKANYGKQVTLYGSLTPYFGMAGLKNTSYYVLPDGTTGGNKPFDPANALFYETFANSLGTFTGYSVLGAQAWANDATYKCAKMSGYSGSKIANEDWLVSPEINLVNTVNPVLSFEHAGKFFGTLSNETTLWISEDYTSGDPKAATWTQLSIPVNVTNTDYTFMGSGDINLGGYVGKKVRIAFKYVSNTTYAGTWEIKNFMIQ